MNERVSLLKEMLFEGNNNTRCCDYARQAWGLSRSQAYRLVNKAWIEIRQDVEEVGVDRREMISLCIGHLQQAAADGLKKGNPGATVAAVREMDALLGLGVNSGRSSRFGWRR